MKIEDDFNKLCTIKRLSQGPVAASTKSKDKDVPRVRHASSRKEIHIELNTEILPSRSVPEPTDHAATEVPAEEPVPQDNPALSAAEEEQTDKDRLIVVAEEAPENEADISFQQTSPQIQLPSTRLPKHGRHMQQDTDVEGEAADSEAQPVTSQVRPENDNELECKRAHVGYA